MQPILVFDLDGTLVDTAPDLIASLNATLATIDVAPVPLEKARYLVGAGVRALLERGLSLSEKSVTDAELEQLFQFYLTYYAAHIADHSRPYPGLMAQLDHFAREGWSLAICTNKAAHLAELLVKTLGIADRFNVLTGGDSFPYKKPDARHLTETVRRAGGGKAIMVGDSQTDFDAARNAGLPIIGVSFGYTPIPMKDLKPDVLIDHFDEFDAAVTQITRHW